MVCFQLFEYHNFICTCICTEYTLGQARGRADHNSSESSDDGTVDLANNTTTNSDYDVFHSNEQSCSNLTPPLLTSMSSPVAVDIASSSQEDPVRHVTIIV